MWEQVETTIEDEPQAENKNTTPELMALDCNVSQHNVKSIVMNKVFTNGVIKGVLRVLEIKIKLFPQIVMSWNVIICHGA